MTVKLRRAMKSSSPRSAVHRVVLIAAYLVLPALMIGSFLYPLTVTELAASKPLPTATPEAKDAPLDKAGVQALVDKLTDALEQAVEDEATRTAITDKWDDRMEKLVGKTSKEVIELLMSDVRSVIQDADKVSKLNESFTAPATADEDAEAAATSDTAAAPAAEVKADETAPAGEPVVATGQIRSATSKSPLQDMSRFNAMKVTAMPSQTWTFKVKAGQITFRYDGSAGIADFKPDKSLAKASIAWIQVVRTGGKDRWYGSVADINAFSKNNASYVLRTEPMYGFRVDRTKGENTPFYDQSVIKTNETLASYRLAFDITDRNTMSGGVINFSDRADAGGGLSRMKAVDPKNTEYRMYFLLSPVNTATGEIYATVEWAVVANGAGGTGRVPSLITKDIPEFRGRDLAFERWNTIFTKQYTPGSPWMGRVVYPIPGRGTYWMK